MRCPNCHKHFRTLEDEEMDHGCPHCGLSVDEKDGESE